MLTDYQTAKSSLESIAASAQGAANNLVAVPDTTVLSGLLDAAVSGGLELLAVACTKMGAAPGYRAEVDALLADPALAAKVTPAHAANLQASADALDAVRGVLANFGQSVRDAQADL